MRTSTVNRKTSETDISLTINIDGSGKSEIRTGNGFFDHMLVLLARHARFDLNVNCIGDIGVDFHHSAEDIGICLGQAFKNALGDKRGVTRYAHTVLPMDEALILAAVDISGRSHLTCELSLPSPRVGSFDTELCEEFLGAFVSNAAVTLHVRQLSGKNTHHIIEGVFKALARCLRAACTVDQAAADDIPSTKGML
ncbi:MAG: imidazoleglycerol-phosphate dehydratase HisB [Clostridia bacterium]|nr:imidazoleglycerol-phosphate dehydratase HisB [Clostridia bacterium]